MVLAILKGIMEDPAINYKIEDVSAPDWLNKTVQEALNVEYYTFRHRPADTEVVIGELIKQGLPSNELQALTRSFCILSLGHIERVFSKNNDIVTVPVNLEYWIQTEKVKLLEDMFEDISVETIGERIPVQIGEEVRYGVLALGGLDISEIQETTEYGDVLDKRGMVGEIFINGIKVADEPNFLFSYNITSMNATLRKALNRERTNVGRSAYSDRIRAILLSAESEEVLSVFTDNLTQMSNGKQADEMKWVDVQAHAVRHLSARKETVYVTPEEVQRSSGAIMEVIRNSGKQPVFVTETVKQKIADSTDISGRQIATIQSVVAQYNSSFDYDFIPYDALTKNEQLVFDLHHIILQEMNSKIRPDQIRIAKTLRPDFPADSFGGVWDEEKSLVIIRRDMLWNPAPYRRESTRELTHRKMWQDSKAYPAGG